MKVSISVFYCHITIYHKCSSFKWQEVTTSQCWCIRNPGTVWLSCVLCLEPLKAKTQVLAVLSSSLDTLGNNPLLSSSRLLLELGSRYSRCKGVFWTRLTFKSVGFQEGRFPSTMWIVLSQSVENLDRTKTDFLWARRNPASRWPSDLKCKTDFPLGL